MTPSQKKYTEGVVGNLYNYKTYQYHLSPPENEKEILVFVSALEKSFGRWYYVCQPLGDKDVPEWMQPHFKVVCARFNELAKIVNT